MTGDWAPFTAVVLAADRTARDPVARAAGVPCKSLAPVGGRPMVLRVIDALKGARQIGSIVLCGPDWSIVQEEPELHALNRSGEVQWVPNRATPSLSTYHVIQGLPPDVSAFVTTADHALLSAGMVDYFCSHVRMKPCDLMAAVASYELVAAAFPDTRRTVMQLKDGAYCGCNMFAFLTMRSRTAADYWRRVEKQRKKTVRVISTLGPVAVLRYLTGRLSLREGLERISRRMGLRAGAVIMPFPEAAVDVDTVRDWRFVEEILS